MRDISISKDGVKTSVLAYISSYAISAIIIVILMIMYYTEILTDEPYKEIIFKTVESPPKTAEIFFFFMIIILTYPLGLLIAWTSWSFLGWGERWLETIHVKKKLFFSVGSKRYYCFEQVKKFFDLNESNYYEISRKIEAQWAINRKKLLQTLDSTQGISNLIRHLILLLVPFAVYSLFNYDFQYFLYIILAFVVLTIVNSVVCFHYSITILFYEMERLKQKGFKNYSQALKSSYNPCEKGS